MVEDIDLDLDQPRPQRSLYHKKYGYRKIRLTPARPQNWDYKKADWECHICGKELKYSSRTNHLRVKHNGIRYLCRICNAGFKRRVTMKAHLDEVHLYEITRRYQCMYCSKAYKRTENLERHVKLVHPKDKKHFHQRCMMCDEMFLTVKELGDHYKEHLEETGGVFVCRFCDKRFKLRSSLYKHLSLIHKLEEGLPFKCDKCDHYALTYRVLRKHLRLNHGGQKIPKLEKLHKCTHVPVVGNDPKVKSQGNCDICGIICTYCAYAFPTQQRFLKHSHNFCCGICRLRFHSARQFKFHVAYHESKLAIQFRCEICKYGFPTYQSLSAHSTKLHKIEDYVCIDCPWCKEKFSTTKRRNHHIMRVHTMERPYKCQDCKFTGVRRKDLVRHTCEGENQTSNSDAPVNIDIEMDVEPNNTDEETNFKCDVCGHCAVSDRKLKKHMKKKHGDPESSSNYNATYENFSDITASDNCLTSEIPSSYNLPEESELESHVDEVASHTDLTIIPEEPDLRLFSCPYCEEKYSTTKRRDRHLMKVHTNTIDRPYKCQDCKFTSVRRKDLVRHTCEGEIQTSGSDAPINIEMEVEANNTEEEINFKCYLCDHYAVSDRKLKKHMKKKHGDPESTNNHNENENYENSYIVESENYENSYIVESENYPSSEVPCNCNTPTESELESHDASQTDLCGISEEPGILLISCPWCEENFSTTKRRDRHLKKVHLTNTIERPYKCQDCNFEGMRRKDLARHNCTDHFPKNASSYMETIDPASISMMETEVAEISSFDENDKLKCDFCDHLAVNLRKLHKHIRKNHEDQEKQCSTETCSPRNVTEKHSASKALSNPYESCGIICSTRKSSTKSGREKRTKANNISTVGNMSASEELVSQITSHSIDDQDRDSFDIWQNSDFFLINCPVCEEKFSTPKMRNRHLVKAHFIEKPYKCEVCKFEDVRRKNFVRHDCTPKAS